jgi:hypothetical protein
MPKAPPEDGKAALGNTKGKANMSPDGEYELTYRALDGQWCKGWFTLSEGGRTITVRRPDGRTKSTQVGGSAGHEESLTKMILSERDHWNEPK